MDLFKSIASGATGEKPAAAKGAGAGIEKKSSTELLASAKVVADSAKCAASGGMEKVDKDKAAGAASDLLDAGSKYGGLKEKGYGQYVDKAQGYLDQFQTAKKVETTTTTTATAPSTVDAPAPAPPTEVKPAAEHHEEKKSDGGVGGLLKTAQGFI